MTGLDLNEIELLAVKCGDESPLIRGTLPALVAEVRRLREVADAALAELDRSLEARDRRAEAERDAARAEAEHLKLTVAALGKDRQRRIAEAARVREALQAERKHHTAVWRECVLDGEVWPCASVRALDAALDGAE